MFLVAFQEVRFGEAYRKRTSVWVSGTFLRELNKTCTGDHEHIQLLRRWAVRIDPQRAPASTQSNFALSGPIWSRSTF